MRQSSLKQTAKQTVKQMLSDLVSAARFVVRGDSMLPTLVDGEAVLAVRLYGPLRRGDIVILHNPLLKGRTFVKRVVGLPNEVLRLDEGLVYVNDELLGEPYLERSFTEYQGAIREWWLGPDQYFVLGDNRDNSRDSRYWGLVPDENLVGRAFYIWMNWSNDSIFDLGSWDVDWERIGSDIN